VHIWYLIQYVQKPGDDDRGQRGRVDWRRRKNDREKHQRIPFSDRAVSGREEYVVTK